MPEDFPEVERDNHVGTLLAVIPHGEGFTYLVWNRDDAPYVLIDEYHLTHMLAADAAMTRFGKAELVLIEAMKEEYLAQR